MTVQNPPNAPRLIANLSDSTTIRLTVLSPATAVRLAHDRCTLESPPPFAGISGLLVTDTDREVQQQWQGELWALGDANNATNVILEVDLGHYPTNT